MIHGIKLRHHFSTSCITLCAETIACRIHPTLEDSRMDTERRDLSPTPRLFPILPEQALGRGIENDRPVFPFRRVHWWTCRRRCSRGRIARQTPFFVTNIDRQPYIKTVSLTSGMGFGRLRMLPFILYSVLLCWTPKVAQAEVSWFLHLSDLHFSEDAEGRAADLSILFEQFFPLFDFSAVLITGDLVHAKVPYSRRSQQRPKEWAQYREMVQTAYRAMGNTSSSTFLDIRGNHDAFDVGKRNGEKDSYRTSAVMGEAWESGRILIHSFFASTACPVYCLVGIDLVPDIGLRSPTNFFGMVTEEILEELEVKIVDDMRKWYGKNCRPVYIAYGHYPMSTVAKKARYFVGNQVELKRILWKYGVAAWLCGHLHDVFGNHLHRLHEGDASTLLELETTDWKVKRRFRIVAVDDGHLSFTDFEMEKASQPAVIRPLDAAMRIEAAVVVIISPPNPHFAPLGNTGTVLSPSSLRVIVWQRDDVTVPSENLHVDALIYCGDDTVAAHTVKKLIAVNGGPVFESQLNYTLFQSLCIDRTPSVQVRVLIEASNRTALSERRPLEPGTKPKPYPHGFPSSLILKHSWCSIFQNLFILLIMMHIFLVLLLPKGITLLQIDSPRDVTLEDVRNRRAALSKMQWIRLFASPFLAFKTASQFPVFWWGQLCYSLLMLFGPWYFPRVLSDDSLGTVFVPTIHVRPTSSDAVAIHSPEMPLRGCQFYITVVLPTTIWMVWTLQRWKDTSKSVRKRYKTLVVYILLGLFSMASFGRSMIITEAYYGMFSVILSPVNVGWIALSAWTVIGELKYRSKLRQE